MVGVDPIQAPPQPHDAHVDPGPPMSCRSIAVLALFLVVLYGALIYIEIGLWWNASDTVQSRMPVNLPWLPATDVSGNTWMLILVLVTGALGSFVHAATSLSDFVGNRKATQSWALWYLLRPLIGSALALVFYLSVRGGLFNMANGSGQSTPFNPYGFAAVAGVVGLSAKQATDKLNEVFDTLFRAKRKGGDTARKNSLTTEEDEPKPPSKG